MSSVVIAGDTSGSITLQAPSIANTSTLTLPATTATLLTDSSGILNIGSGQVYKDASGNVGIGTTSPSSKLDIGSSAGAGPLSTLTFSGLNSASAKTNYVQFVPDIGFAVAGSESGGFTFKTLQNGAYKDSIVAGGTLANASNYLSFGTTNPAMRIDSSGNVTLQKNISVGAAAPTTSGSGITFPATQAASSNANTLDDYEEGTWTPVPTGITFAGTASYTANYTKIGRLVTANLVINGQPTVHQWNTITLPFPIFGTTAGIANCLGGDIGNGSVAWASWSSNLLTFGTYKIIDANGLHMCVIYNTTT